MKNGGSEWNWAKRAERNITVETQHTEDKKVILEGTGEGLAKE